MKMLLFSNSVTENDFLPYPHFCVSLPIFKATNQLVKILRSRLPFSFLLFLHSFQLLVFAA